MVISVSTLDHVSVTVADLERSLAFYRDMLGLEEVERHHLEGKGISTMAGKPEVVMDVVRLRASGTPSVLIDLQQYREPVGGRSGAQLGDVTHAHFCFGVADIEAAYQQLRAHGIDFISGPVSFELESGVLKVVFVKDPDGFVLELVEYPQAG